VAGLSSTAADYFRFAQMILNGGELDGVRLLSPSTVNLMISNHTGDQPIYIRGRDAYGFGLGFSMLTDPASSREGLMQAITEGYYAGPQGIRGYDPIERRSDRAGLAVSSPAARR